MYFLVINANKEIPEIPFANLPSLPISPTTPQSCKYHPQLCTFCSAVTVGGLLFREVHKLVSEFNL